MRLIWFLFVLNVPLFFVLQVPPAYALSCIEPPPIEETYKQYDGIVIAEVVSIQRDTHVNRLELHVTTSYKGIQETSIEVQEDITWGTSKAGEIYLFFLRQTDHGWEHPLCSPTQTADQAAGKLAYLEGKEIPLAADAQADDESAAEIHAPGLLESDSTEDANLNIPHRGPLYVGAGIVVLSVILLAIRRIRNNS